MSPATVTPETSAPATAVIDAESVVDSMQQPTLPKPHLAVGALLLGTALLSSGASGLINQVIWQRALKVFLGGAETVCSTVVVLVFMAGLGAGSWWSGRRAAALKNPLASFSHIELLLGGVNIGICGLLAADLSHTVFTAQQFALTFGVPLLLMYAIGASVVLTIPCFLMGATMPLAAEVCQRNFRLKDSRLLGWLLFVNTAGSVAGAVISSGFMMSHLGLSRSLVVAASLNICAGSVLLFVRMFASNPARQQQANDGCDSEETELRSQTAPHSSFLPTQTDMLALGLGFCSLAYEMHLFRLMPQKQQPLPFTFSAVLVGFLLFWSIGAALSSRLRSLSISRALQLCAAGCVLSIAFAAWDSPTPITGVASLIGFVLARTHFFLPCVLFGYLFARVTEEAATSWGRDVARIYVWNTVGSCLGILLMTFVGYEIPYFLAIIAVSLVLLSLRSCLSTEHRSAAAIPLGFAGLIVAGCLMFDTTHILPGYRMFCGRDGVIAVKDNGEMMWDGLWHSSLSDGQNHIGTHNWHLAVMPAVCHADAPVEDVCIIGVGTGITAATLAKHSDVRSVDAYDISRVLENVFEAYPEGTLNVATHDKINFIWQDARSGLELNPKQYDIIQTQPLYLKQAGSGLLNSVEFFDLVSRRLKPGGVFCLYSNGTPEQAFVVRETADRVFPYRETFFNGYLAILSNDPIDVNEATLRRCLSHQDPMWREIRQHDETANAAAILALRDVPALPGHNGELVVTDDRPLVEYPAYLRSHLRSHPLPFELPAPDSSFSLK